MGSIPYSRSYVALCLRCVQGGAGFGDALERAGFRGDRLSVWGVQVRTRDLHPDASGCAGTLGCALCCSAMRCRVCALHRAWCGCRMCALHSAWCGRRLAACSCNALARVHRTQPCLVGHIPCTAHALPALHIRMQCALCM